MNREEIIRMAREADMDVDHAESNAWGAIITAEPADLERFAALVAAKEREECARVAAWILKMPQNDVSEAIRARGNDA
jgi:hypothetical protein